MTNRVVLDEDGLRVSVSGIDVLSAAPEQLNFNSDWSSLGRWLVGSQLVNFNAASGFTIPFGRTFAHPPLAMFRRLVGSDVYWLGGSSGFVYQYGAGFDPNQHYIEAYTTVNSIFLISLIQGAVPSFTFEYNILDFSIG